MKKPLIASSNKIDFLPIDAVGNSFVIKEWTGSGPDYLHVHYADDEAWHILEGTLTFKFSENDIRKFSS